MAINQKIRSTEGFIEYLNKNFDQFTPTQKKLANYLITNSEDAAFLTCDEISGKINTTPSTITRFAKEIGLSGFPEFKKRLKKILINKVNSIEHFSGQFEKAKLLGEYDKSDAINKSLSNDFSNLEKLIKLVNKEDIKKSVDIISSARKKYIVASRSSYSLGHFLYFQTKKIIPEVFFLNNIDGDIFSILRAINHKDVLLPICFPRYTKTTVDLANFAHKKRTKIISITDSRISPLSKISNVSLYCPHESPAPFHSYTSAFALINAILSELFYLNYDLSVQNLKDEEMIIQKLNLYHKHER